jgi:hypothetical protein
MARFCRVPDTPVTATYGAPVTTTIRRWVIALLITLASLALIAVVSVNLLMMGEEICEDRSPWWGPPEDPNSECSGLWWAEKHPGEYPWTMPR